ncbi:hypothetical protein CK203_100881 [Vitis vinifera]|uniref:Uncharacterized protein n=1 Tax=Vitis vinifera TaxID=29760 RepID=A0A438CZP7_VITVI|nr:hypothetical protein CK203_100881 [Vitis vinifera]
MDIVLQIFKRSICPGTPFFICLAKKPSKTMDILFKCANKCSMLEDEVRAATQQTGKGQGGPQQSSQASFTLLSISYEKLLPIICELSNFRCPEPIKMDLAKKDQSRKCTYHKEHGHTTEQCKSLHYLVKKLIRVGHLKQYIRTKEKREEATQNLAATTPTTSVAPRVIINYIHGGPLMRNTTLNGKGKDYFKPPPYENELVPFDPDWLREAYLSPFNSIMGRTWLEGMKDIPSTYHQMVMSYLTEEGQINLYESQLAALRHFHPDRQKIIQAEVDKLLAARFIREVEYPDWLEHRGQSGSDQSCHGDVRPKLQKGVVASHRSSRRTRVFHSPVYRQIKVIRLGFPASNNEAEYEAILFELDLSLALSTSKLEICSDSQLVVRHIQGEYEVGHQKNTLDRLNKWAIKRIPRTKKVQVNALAGIAATFPIKEAVLLPAHLQTISSIVVALICNTNETSASWMHDIKNYLQIGNHPEESKITHKIRVQAVCFTLIEDCLYRRSFGGPYLRFLNNMEAWYVLAELHEDAEDYVKRCDRCQKHASIPPMPLEVLNPVKSPWPFVQWEINIVVPLPVAATQKKLLLVANDYFNKWVEVEAYANIKDKDVSKTFYSELKIKNLYFTPQYPQSNGKTEATNKIILSALKKMLEKSKGMWVDELPSVLWAQRTTLGQPTGNTPFTLAYGMDAIIPKK